MNRIWSRFLNPVCPLFVSHNRCCQSDIIFSLYLIVSMALLLWLLINRASWFLNSWLLYTVIMCNMSRDSHKYIYLRKPSVPNCQTRIYKSDHYQIKVLCCCVCFLFLKTLSVAWNRPSSSSSSKAAKRESCFAINTTSNYSWPSLTIVVCVLIKRKLLLKYARHRLYLGIDSSCLYLKGKNRY